MWVKLEFGPLSCRVCVASSVRRAPQPARPPLLVTVECCVGHLTACFVGAVRRLLCAFSVVVVGSHQSGPGSGVRRYLHDLRQTYTPYVELPALPLARHCFSKRCFHVWARSCRDLWRTLLPRPSTPRPARPANPSAEPAYPTNPCDRRRTPRRRSSESTWSARA